MRWSVTLAVSSCAVFASVRAGTQEELVVDARGAVADPQGLPMAHATAGPGTSQRVIVDSHGKMVETDLLWEDRPAGDSAADSERPLQPAAQEGLHRAALVAHRAGSPTMMRHEAANNGESEGEQEFQEKDSKRWWPWSPTPKPTPPPTPATQAPTPAPPPPTPAPSVAPPPPGVPAPAPLELSAAARAKWSNYVSETQAAYAAQGTSIQAGCQPALHEPQGAYKGTVILFHGFTACNQQFEQLAPRLTAHGFLVLMPLLPGHGAVHKATKQVNAGPVWCPWCTKRTTPDDFIDMLPSDYKEYQLFAKKMIEIMEGAGGETAVFGLSLGGAIAAWAGQQFPFTRQFIAVPMVQLGGVLDNIARFLNWVTFTAAGEIEIGWGEGCYNERDKGRAGICDFKKKHVLAGRDLGSHDYDSLKGPLPNAVGGGVQFVFVEGDGAVSTHWVQELATKSGVAKTTPYICGFDAAVGHSFLSTYDNPDQNKYWLDEVTRKVADYLGKGTALPQSGSVSAERGWPRCQLVCTAQSCPWTNPNPSR